MGIDKFDLLYFSCAISVLALIHALTYMLKILAHVFFLQAALNSKCQE